MLKAHYTRDYYYCDCTGKETENVSYDLDNKIIRCNDCGTEYKQEPHKDTCYRCRREYKKYAWWVPSGCPHCNRSFVD